MPYQPKNHHERLLELDVFSTIDTCTCIKKVSLLLRFTKERFEIDRKFYALNSCIKLDNILYKSHI